MPKSSAAVTWIIVFKIIYTNLLLIQLHLICLIDKIFYQKGRFIMSASSSFPSVRIAIPTCPICIEPFTEAANRSRAPHEEVKDSKGKVIYDGTKHPLHPHCLVEWLQKSIPKGIESNKTFKVQCLGCRHEISTTCEKILQLAVEILKSHAEQNESVPMDTDAAPRPKRPGSPLSLSSGAPKKNRTDAASSSSAMDIVHDRPHSFSSSAAASSSSSLAANPSAASSSAAASSSSSLPGLNHFGMTELYDDLCQQDNFAEAIEIARKRKDSIRTEDYNADLKWIDEKLCNKVNGLFYNEKFNGVDPWIKMIQDPFLRVDWLTSLSLNLSKQKNFTRAIEVAQEIEDPNLRKLALDQAKADGKNPSSSLAEYMLQGHFYPRNNYSCYLSSWEEGVRDMIAKLEQGITLKELSNNQIVAVLTQGPQLKHLRTSSNPYACYLPLNPAACQALANHRNFQALHLDLSTQEFPDDLSFLETLAKNNPALETLSLGVSNKCRSRDCLPEGILFAFAKHCPRLKVLSMGPSMTDAALAMFAKECPDLEALAINFSSVTDEGLQSFVRQRPHLKRLSVDQASVTSKSLQTIASCCTEIVALQIGPMEVGVGAMYLIAEKCRSLRAFSFYDSNQERAAKVLKYLKEKRPDLIVAHHLKGLESLRYFSSPYKDDPVVQEILKDIF